LRYTVKDPLVYIRERRRSPVLDTELNDSELALVDPAWPVGSFLFAIRLAPSLLSILNTDFGVKAFEEMHVDELLPVCAFRGINPKPSDSRAPNFPNDWCLCKLLRRIVDIWSRLWMPETAAQKKNRGGEATGDDRPVPRTHVFSAGIIPDQTREDFRRKSIKGTRSSVTREFLAMLFARYIFRALSPEFIVFIVVPLVSALAELVLA
jgi:hypothetical protein